jgi:hypothetical protein
MPQGGGLFLNDRSFDVARHSARGIKIDAAQLRRSTTRRLDRVWRDGC